MATGKHAKVENTDPDEAAARWRRLPPRVTETAASVSTDPVVPGSIATAPDPVVQSLLRYGAAG
jgi:hypothetical protein